MKELSFREVIANIKEGEVWESDIKRIKLKNGGLYIKLLKEIGTLECYAMDVEQYTLQRKQYIFEEAFRAYEEGKEIESCESGNKYKKIDGEDNNLVECLGIYMTTEKGIMINEIRGKWYINS